MDAENILLDDSNKNIFPMDIFGKIPKEVTDVLVESGFDNLVSLITLTEDDINQIEIARKCQIKMGHKRYMMQMADYAKKAIGKKFDANKIQASETNKWKLLQRSAANETNVEVAETKRGMKRKFDSNENISKILEQSLKKTASKFCLEHKIDKIAPPLIKIVRSEDSDVCASLVCKCGNDPVTVYPHTTKSNWVTSNYLRHLNRLHTPGTSGNKITNFLKPKGTARIDEVENKTANLKDSEASDIIYQEPNLDSIDEQHDREAGSTQLNEETSGEFNGGLSH